MTAIQVMDGSGDTGDLLSEVFVKAEKVLMDRRGEDGGGRRCGGLIKLRICVC